MRGVTRDDATDGARGWAPRGAAAAACTVALALGIATLALVPASAEAQFNFYRDDHVRNRPAHLGFSAIGGGQAHTQNGTVDGFFALGLDVIGTLVPGFALGFTRAGLTFGYSDLEGFLFGANATPTFEFSFFPGSDVQIFLQLGATVGFHTETRLRPLGVDAAVTTTIGARFWISNLFTFGFFIGNDIGVTNPGIRRWLGGGLGQGELSFFGGLELGWNL